MDPDQILRIVDSFHRDKNIDTEIVFRAGQSLHSHLLPDVDMETQSSESSPSVVKMALARHFDMSL